MNNIMKTFWNKLSFNLWKKHRILSLTLNDNNEVELKIKANVLLTIDGDVSVVSYKNMCVDTYKSKLFLNNRVSKQIKDLPDSVKFRKTQLEKQIQNLTLMKEITQDKIAKLPDSKAQHELQLINLSLRDLEEKLLLEGTHTQEKIDDTTTCNE